MAAGKVCARLAQCICIVGFALLFAVAPVAPKATAQTSSFSGVEVVGNQRIESDTIRVFAGIIPGQRVSAAEINEALQRLFDTGLFEDVKITRSGNRLVITVVENPTINIINFEGNSRLKDDQLSQVISLRPRRAYSRAAAEADAQAIIDAYAAQGRFAASVRPVIIRLSDNRVNLVYEIFEGRVTEVQRISFVGNERFSDRRLRRVIETSQAGLLSFLFKNDVYDQDRLELDKQKLREFYLNRGYIDFEVLAASAEIARERNGFFLNFSVKEGPQYRYGEVFVSTLAAGLDPAEFEAKLDLRRGDVYSAKRVERVIERLAFLAGQRGYAFIDVVPRITKNDDQTVDIEFELVEGPRVYIERIDIRGNGQTQDRVVRRQFRVVEGDAFNAREIRRAEGRIRASRLFDRVETRVREGSGPDRAVVTVDLEEAATGSLSFGAAFSSSDGIAGTVSLSERNFLGRGQAVSLELARGRDINTFAFSFTEPALFDQDLALGFNLFYREASLSESSVKTRNIGFTPRLEFPLTEDSRLQVRARVSQDRIKNTSPDTTSPIILREQGDLLTTSLGFRYTLDKRNSPIDPTAGFILTFDQDFAGLADRGYSKSVLSARAYTSLFNEDVILSAEVEGGALVSFTGDTRLTERFTLGGDSFRGFARGGLGPRDRCTACSGGGLEDVNDSLGGNMYAVAKFEASFPIGVPEEYGIYGGLFADVGTIWSLYDTAGASGTIDDAPHLRASVGASIFWETAIGPLRFNYGIPIVSEDGDVFERFRLTVDTRF
ncbi:outer membrane protein assembly factor BamA [Halovulum sp. GXIMD14793]